MTELKLLIDLLFFRNSVPINIFLSIILWIVLLICFYFFIIFIRHISYRIYLKIFTSQITTQQVVGKVVRKDYIPKRFMYGRTPLLLPEEYNVHVVFENYKDIINNKNIFNKTKLENEITLKLIKRISKKGKVLEASLKLPSSN
ncbi:MAG: hypothetical protein E7311_07245 [Clostridiales bacterium]|nr:hypothetical protein [Clostridiales bacterium]